MGEGEQEFASAGRRQRQVGLPQLGGTAAARGLTALGFQAGVDAALQARDIVIGQIGAQRCADRFAGAAGGIDEGVAQAFERAVDRTGNCGRKSECHLPSMSQQTCHSSGGSARFARLPL